jgi:hypothetical protein
MRIHGRDRFAPSPCDDRLTLRHPTEYALIYWWFSSLMSDNVRFNDSVTCMAAGVEDPRAGVSPAVGACRRIGARTEARVGGSSAR